MASLGASEPIRFDRDIRPILSDKCFHCHGPDNTQRQADLRLDLEEAAKEWAIVPGKPDESEVYQRMVSPDAELRMPPPGSNKTLTTEEQETLRRWIEQGAAWTQHWAFVPPRQVEPFRPAGVTWGSHPIDDFVLARLIRDGLTPNPEADRITLIRRVTYDLTGLPPTLEEVDQFLADPSPNAYEKVVDRLLASRHFGQRMAVMWMDAARYGDTSVYHADGPRDMWAWRDAIVEAYNENMPFDQFTIAQLAGDLLPDATLKQRVLAGFNRNNGTTDEGGAIAEEYRVEYAVDRVKTTSTVWLGMTMECAQCHDHKYDPISQEDYYRFYAFFNVSADKGMQTRKGNAEPTLAIPDPEKQKKLPDAKARLAAKQERLAQHTTAIEPEFIQWLHAQQKKHVTNGQPPSNDMLLQAEFLEGTGATTADSTTLREARIHGKAEWVSTPRDQGLKFSGNNYVDFGDVGSFERSDAFSYGGWVKPRQGSGALLARMDDGNGHRGYDLYVSPGPVSVHLIHHWPDNAIKVTTKKKLKANQWYHVLATYDGSSQADGVRIYVNGQPWEWTIEQDGLTDSIVTEKTLLAGSRHTGSRLRGEIDAVQVFGCELSAKEVESVAGADAVHLLLAVADSDRTEAQTQALREHFFKTESEPFRSLTQEISELEEEVAELQKPLTTVMVMGDMAQPRDTFILHRGAYDSPTDQKVQPGTIAVLPSIPETFPKNRLGLARWLFEDNHPLTARVAVNRYWQMLFGTGLVGTPGDFGAQGEFPSHPGLLDWLAVDFREHGWNIKRTLKQIVMSATYRQSSRSAAEVYRQDAANRLLARGPRFRLQAEFIRDTALAVSGLLDPRFGGPGVKPYQPSGLWAEVGLGAKPVFTQDHGDKLYRRSLYTYWKRSAPPPTMQIFDAPTREKCIVQRPRTNTPLQALVVLNDPQFVEASRHFAARILARSAHSDFERVVYGFRLATARLPQETEVSALLRILNTARQQYRQTPEAASQLLAVGESPSDESLDAEEHAAWTVVANSILNLDETLTRE